MILLLRPYLGRYTPPAERYFGGYPDATSGDHPSPPCSEAGAGSLDPNVVAGARGGRSEYALGTRASAMGPAVEGSRTMHGHLAYSRLTERLQSLADCKRTTLSHQLAIELLVLVERRTAMHPEAVVKHDQVAGG